MFEKQKNAIYNKPIQYFMGIHTSIHYTSKLHVTHTPLLGTPQDFKNTPSNRRDVFFCLCSLLKYIFYFYLIEKKEKRKKYQQYGTFQYFYFSSNEFNSFFFFNPTMTRITHAQSQRGLASVTWSVIADVGYGESVVIVGDHTALGDGNVNLGLSLVTSKESWYILFIDVFLLLSPPNKLVIQACLAFKKTSSSKYWSRSFLSSRCLLRW